MPESNAKRRARLMPGGVPRYVRIYDNGGESADRYTVVFTGNFKNKGVKRNGEGRTIPRGYCFYVAMSGAPGHPQGVCQHGEHFTMIDRPTYGHLGKKIKFEDLPEDCREVVLSDYIEMWGLAPPAPVGDPDAIRKILDI